ncbi:hypothetical protein CsSME_00010090 [Camellia sinensis var. sinensis]
MAPSKLRKAIGAVKDKTSIGLAKVGSSASLADLDVAIVKATRHQEYPADERHIREVLNLTCYSRAYIGASIATIAKRLNKTKNWIVAIKTLVLIQRLLTDGDPAFEQEIFFATRRGTRLLNMSDFRDTSQSDSWDYSAFVRTYALYLDEQLEFRTQSRKKSKRGITAYDEEDDEVASPSSARDTPVRDMKNEHVFSRVHHLMQLLERVLACRPTGKNQRVTQIHSRRTDLTSKVFVSIYETGTAKHNRVVHVALYPLVKESFQIYYDITEILGILIERFMGLEVSDSVKVHEIFCRISKQFDELDEFYGWCKKTGIARSSEYPEVEKVTQNKLDVMDEYIRDKSESMHNRRAEYLEQKSETEEEDKKSEVVEEDTSMIKALPPPEELPEPEKEEKEEVAEEPKEKDNNTIVQIEADLLNLREDAVTSKEHGDKLALALFDGGAPVMGPGTTPAWEAFKDMENWETTLVQSTSHLSNQNPSLPGGFDMMLLNGMYQQGATTHAMASSGFVTTGSASSVAFGSAGRPAMLALPAPPAADGSVAAITGADPFAASLPVPPPAFVQMSEMEKKQRMLVEEQLMWQQYARDGMHGQVGLTNMQPNTYPYNMGGYTHTY